MHLHRCSACRHVPVVPVRYLSAALRCRLGDVSSGRLWTLAALLPAGHVPMHVVFRLSRLPGRAYLWPAACANSCVPLTCCMKLSASLCIWILFRFPQRRCRCPQQRRPSLFPELPEFGGYVCAMDFFSLYTCVGVLSVCGPHVHLSSVP